MSKYKYDYFKYADNKVCPVMSPAVLKMNSTVIRCMENDCMWYEKCRSTGEGYYDERSGDFERLAKELGLD